MTCLILYFLGFTCVAGTPQGGQTLVQLKKRPAKQPKTYSVRFDPKKPGLAIVLGRKNYSYTLKSAGLLRKLAASGPTLDRPFFYLKYANVLTDLDYDPAAYQLTRHLMVLNTKTPFNRKIHGTPKSIKEFQARAAILNARILTRNGLKKDALAALKTFKPRTGYDYALLAEVYVLLDQKDDAAKAMEKAFTRKNGHPERNFNRAFVPMWATFLANRIERPDLAMRFGKQIMNRGVNAEKWPQWKAACTITSKNIELSSQGPTPEFRGLKPGIYSAKCRGYVGDIEVKVTVDRAGKPTIAIAKQREDRPFSSLTVVPRRINRKRSLKVDAVTGATITSQAVITAAEEAIRKASR